MVIFGMNMGKHTVCLQIIVILISLSRSVALKYEVHLVYRRLHSDIMQYNSGFEYWYFCDHDNFTFLVNDRRCITNEELFNGNKLL